MAPKCSTEYNIKVLSCVPNCKKGTMCLTEDIQVLDKLHSDVNHKPAGHNFSVKKSICLNMVSLNRNAHKAGFIWIG